MTAVILHIISLLMHACALVIAMCLGAAVEKADERTAITTLIVAVALFVVAGILQVIA